MPPGTTSAAGQGGREPWWGRATKKQGGTGGRLKRLTEFRQDLPNSLLLNDVANQPDATTETLWHLLSDGDLPATAAHLPANSVWACSHFMCQAGISSLAAPCPTTRRIPCCNAMHNGGSG